MSLYASHVHQLVYGVCARSACVPLHCRACVYVCVYAQRVSMPSLCVCSAQQQALCSQSDVCVCSTCRAAYKPYVTCQQVGLLVLMLCLACVLVVYCAKEQNACWLFST